jgi:hypothetical protein
MLHCSTIQNLNSQSLEKAFDFVIQIQKKDEEKYIAYTGRCRHCGKYIGEENLKEVFG